MESKNICDPTLSYYRYSVIIQMSIAQRNYYYLCDNLNKILHFIAGCDDDFEIIHIFRFIYLFIACYIRPFHSFLFFVLSLMFGSFSDCFFSFAVDVQQFV